MLIVGWSSLTGLILPLYWAQFAPPPLHDMFPVRAQTLKPQDMSMLHETAIFCGPLLLFVFYVIRLADDCVTHSASHFAAPALLILK